MIAIRPRVLGDADINTAEVAKTDAGAAFQALITDAAWGHVWACDTDQPPGVVDTDYRIYGRLRQ